MMFNMGATRFTKEKWGHFYEAVNQHDWLTAATESHKLFVSTERASAALAIKSLILPILQAHDPTRPSPLNF